MAPLTVLLPSGAEVGTRGVWAGTAFATGTHVTGGPGAPPVAMLGMGIVAGAVEVEAAATHHLPTRNVWN